VRTFRASAAAAAFMLAAAPAATNQAVAQGTGLTQSQPTPPPGTTQAPIVPFGLATGPAAGPPPPTMTLNTNDTTGARDVIPVVGDLSGPVTTVVGVTPVFPQVNGIGVFHIDLQDPVKRMIKELIDSDGKNHRFELHEYTVEKLWDGSTLEHDTIIPVEKGQGTLVPVPGNGTVAGATLIPSFVGPDGKLYAVPPRPVLAGQGSTGTGAQPGGQAQAQPGTGQNQPAQSQQGQNQPQQGQTLPQGQDPQRQGSTTGGDDKSGRGGDKPQGAPVKIGSVGGSQNPDAGATKDLKQDSEQQKPGKAGNNQQSHRSAGNGQHAVVTNANAAAVRADAVAIEPSDRQTGTQPIKPHLVQSNHPNLAVLSSINKAQGGEHAGKVGADAFKSATNPNPASSLAKLTALSKLTAPSTSKFQSRQCGKGGVC
jgi:hypothetical protein